MTRYTYRRRPLGSCRAQRAARAAEVGQNLANAIALYERPLLLHSGPNPMRMEEDYSIPYPWPWVRLDTATVVPTRLDEATVYLTHAKGSHDISLRLIGLTHVDPEVNIDPVKMPSIMPCLITAELCQYVSGTSATVIASKQIQQDIICYPDTVHPWYPLLSELALGWKAGKGGYNPNLQEYSGGGLLRVGQIYPPDLAILQRVRLSIDFGDAGWSPSFTSWRTNPSFIRITCELDTSKTPVWEPQAQQDFEYVRIFCIGSEIRERGRI